MSNRKVMIVFEETGEQAVNAHGQIGKKYLVYLAGDIDRIKAGVDEDKLGSAEFWGWRMFGVIQQVMQQAGAFDPANPMQEHKGMKQ